jgi:hypothetical protein
MAYFNYFPEIAYDVRGKKNNVRIDFVTNILVRARKKIEITNASLFEQYFIRDGDRADTLAYQFYSDSTLHWIIMYANYMTDPYYSWPMTYFDLQKYITKKYDNPNGIHHYEDSDGNVVQEPGTPIDVGVPPVLAGNATPVTNSIYEEELNDTKRTIDIIKPEYVQQIVKEFKQLLSES